MIKNLTAAIQKQTKQTKYKGNPIRLSADFSAENLQARRNWQDIFQVLKVKKQMNKQPKTQNKTKIPKVLYPARLPSRTEGEKKSFPNKS